MAFGGKGVQVESGAVEGVLVDGTQFSNCFMAMSAKRDGGITSPVYGVQFTNIKADNCEILFLVRQANINNTNGLDHTVQLNNFYAVNCGSFEGVMQFSRASNVQVSNGVIVNNSAVVATPLIRGNHRFCRFDNIRFSGNCPRIIDLDPSTFALDSSYPCENNTYDINYSGTAGYVAYASTATANKILQDCKIVANLDSDVSTKIVGDELRNGFCEMYISQGGKTIITTTATFYLEGRTTFASYPAGVSVPRFNASQVTFPAVQISSTDVNTLDDYEEGTWVPTDTSGASLSFTGVHGAYTKIGRMVYAQFSVTYPTTANGSIVRIGNLPFASGPGFGGFALRFTDSNQSLSFTMNASGTEIIGLNTAGTLIVNSSLSGKTISGLYTYMSAT